MDYDDVLNFSDLNDEIENLLVKSEYQNQLKIQLEEIDVLRAMYYKDKEFIIDDKILTLVNNYVEEKASQLPPAIDFIINFIVEDLSLECQVFLPKLYPTTKPKMFVRSSQLNGNQTVALNADLKSFLSSIDWGTICVSEGIQWVSDNINKYKEEKFTCSQVSLVPERLFVRHWIYSHHIYSKDKRRYMISLSKQCNVTGFCLSGKPGIICIEGWDPDCNEWWQKVKSLTWKKIIRIKKEESTLSNDSCENVRKFQGFNEISFQNSKNHKTDTHTDMGEFYKYLTDHDCGHMFKDYFGFEGKNSSSS